MMLWALVFAADMAAGFTAEPKRRRKNEMLGDGGLRLGDDVVDVNENAAVS